MFGSSVAFVFAIATSVVFAAPFSQPIESVSNLPFYFPKSVSTHFPLNHASNFKAPSNEDSVKIGTAYICDRLGLSNKEFKAYNTFTDAAGITHIYGAHVVNGIRIANHQAAVHIKAGQIISFSSSFGTKSHFAKSDLSTIASEPKLSFKQVSDQVTQTYHLPMYTKFAYMIEYVAQADGSMAQTYKFQLRDNPLTQWVQVWAHTDTGKVIHAVNFKSKASYKVIPIPKVDVNDGFEMVKNPEFNASSPQGWTDGQETTGNNVLAADQTSGTPSSGINGAFDSSFNPQEDPRTAANVKASAINLFYIGNIVHDISYQYGFTEAAGNFQKDNFGKGGEGNDVVVINVQSTAGTDDAKFYAPADGQPGEMDMFRFTTTTPNRDGGLDNVIPIHEYVHGISNRLTGGAATTQCLEALESGGMGEGWSDTIAMYLTSKKTDVATTPIVMGAYATGDASGIRSHPYTTDIKVNPLTYADLKTRDEVHDIGEVWAVMLWEVYWNLVTKNGFSTDLYNAKGKAGNIIALQNVIGGMMIQPCNPTFLDARDAIIASDAARYNGANKCEIWKGFSKRGMGPNARNHQNDFSVPAECKDGAGSVGSTSSLSTATKTSASSTEIATSSIGKSISSTETATSSIGKSISSTETATLSIGKSASATETAASATETTLVATEKSTSTTAVATSSPVATQSSPDPKPRTTTHDKPHHTHSTKLSSTRQPSVPTPHPKCHA